MSDWHPEARLLTITEAAASISRPASTVRRWISEGRLEPAADNGRTRFYYESDVHAVDASLRRRKNCG